MPDTTTVSAPDTATDKPLPRPPRRAGPSHRRAHLAPHAAVGTLVVAAGAARIAAHLTGDDVAVAEWTAGAAFVIAVVAGTLARRRLTDRRTLARVYAFLTLAVGWLTTVAATELDRGAVGLLMALGYGLSAHWWRTHPVGWVGDSADRPEHVALWEDNVGATDGALPGTRLSRPEPIRAGVRYVCRLRPGRQTYGQAINLVDKIRGGLELAQDQDLIIEKHPRLPEPNLLITVVTRSPVKKPVIWPGPSAFDPATGRVALGPYVDGEGFGSWKVYTQNSIWGGFLAGSTGSGKSYMFNSLAMSMAASTTHPTVIWFIDGDEGASSRLLVDHADHVALDPDLDRARDMLAGALNIMRVRRAENIAEGWDGFTPTVDRPGILIFIDECHIIFADQQCREMAAEISRRGRKVGVGIVAASQVATLDAFGGEGARGTDALRGSLRAGNGVVLRSLTANTKAVFGVDIDPTKFPDIPGYAYYVAPKGSSERTAPLRGFDVSEKARGLWLPRITWRSLPGAEGRVYGDGYVNRRELAAAERAATQEWVTKVKAGRATAVRAAERVREAAEQASVTVLESFGGVGFRSWSDMTAEAAKTAEAKLGDSHRKVLDALAAGHRTPKDIAPHVGVKERRVHDLLNDLIDAGKVRRTGPKGGQGRYELVDQKAA